MLLGLLDEHRGAFEYDWRNRFHLGISAIPDDMSWGEASRLTTILIGDPSSRLGATLAGWQYPTTREDLTLRSLFDLQGRSKYGRKHATHPRPWDPQSKRFGAGASVSVSEFQSLKASLAVRNDLPDPN